MKGCDLGDECEPDQNVIQKAINFVSMKAHPSLLNEDQSEVITYSPDMTYYRFLDPLISQQTNVFLTESTISIKDSIYDLFETSESEHKLI